MAMNTLAASLRRTTLVSVLAASALTLACSSDDTPAGDEPGGEGGGPEPTLPAASGPCPAFAEGRATFTVNGAAREVQLYVDPAAAAAADGPLIFYWYGTLGTPDQAIQGLTAEGIADVKARGGIVAAPVHVNAGTFPWINGDLQTEAALMDEVTACAKQSVGIDARHIHSLGFSAGGIFTSQISFARSSYLASVATYSGGADGQSVDPANPFAAMVIYGGSSDQLVLQFEKTSTDYKNKLMAEGHFAFLCNHGGGHRIPADAGGSVVKFFADHGYKTTPEPYAAGLPQGFPAYCTL